MKFETYPFEKLANILKDIVPNKDYSPYTLTIGEPQFDTPSFIQDELSGNSSLLNKYPKSASESFLKESMRNFVKRRFDVDLKENELISSFGTKEILFNFPQYYLYDKQNPTMLFSNPFYQIYEGSAIASRADIIYIDLKEENNFLPILSHEDMKRANLVIINYPNNPTSATIDIDYLVDLVKKSIEYDFVLLNDECYSEIYTNKTNKPISLLQACLKAKNYTFKNALVVNSLSKRSSAPGLRSGFIAGDSTILEGYGRYRTYLGCALPLPLQKASAVAWNDDNHVAEFRKKYKENLLLAHQILGVDIPDATFYIWLKVGDDLEFAKRLYKEKNIKVLPGRFLGRNSQGEGYVRIALVEDSKKCKDILLMIKEVLDLF